MKKIIVYLLFLLPWFLSSILFNIDGTYYASLKLPFFVPPVIMFDIIQIIIYVLISYNTLKIYEEYKFDKDTKNYYILLIMNFILNQLLIPIFFCMNNLFLTFVNTLAILISSLWLYYENNKLNNQNSKLLFPYIIWNIFATILSLSIYFINL